MCSMYENIDDGAFIGRKQNFVPIFKVNFLGLGFFFWKARIYNTMYLEPM